MKINRLIIIAFFLLSPFIIVEKLRAEEKIEAIKTDLEKEGLKGKIKTIKTKEYYASSCKQKDSIKLGNREADNLITRLYNEKGNYIEISSKIRKQVPQRIRSEYRYNPENVLIEKTRYENEELALIIKYTTDSQGRRSEVREYDKEGVLKSVLKREYNDDGSAYSETDQLGFKTIYSLFPNGLIAQITSYNPDGDELGKESFKYDGQGREVASCYESDKGANTSVTSYDENGLIARFTLVEITEDYTFQYEFDERGNWIKRTEYEKGIIIIVSGREIEYYD